jgi:porin
MNRSTSVNLKCLRFLIGQAAIACSINLIGMMGATIAAEPPPQSSPPIQTTSVEPDKSSGSDLGITAEIATPETMSPETRAASTTFFTQAPASEIFLEDGSSAQSLPLKTNSSSVEPEKGSDSSLKTAAEITTPEAIFSESSAASTTLPAQPSATEITFEDESPIFTVPLSNFAASALESGTVRVAQTESADSEDLPVSYKAADLGAPTAMNFADSDVFQLAELTQSPNPASEVQRPPPISRALNLWSVRSLRKPVGRKVLDTGVSIAGPKLRDMSESFWTRDYLTGNWGGLRDELYDSGIEFTFAAFIDVFSNISGGNSQNTAYSSVNTISFDFFTDRLGLWPHGQIHWTNAWIDGANVSVGRNYAGALNSVFFADPPRRGLRLFELWYGHKFFEDQLDVRLGKIYPFVKFGISQVATVFQNSNFGYPGFIGTNPSFGYSTLYGAAPFGLEVLYSPKDSPWFVQTMVMDGFDDPTAGPYANNKNSNSNGLDLISLSSKEGAEGILEVGYKLNQEKGATGLPGTYRAGFQWHTGEFESFTKDANGQNRTFPFASSRATERGNHAFYFVGEQMLYRESPDPKDRTQGLSAFLKGTIAPPGDINTIDFNVAGGLVYEGPFPGRDRDLIGIGIAHTKLSSGIRELARNSIGIDPTVTEIPSGETALELMYAAEISPWWLLIFSVQHIINPSFNAFEDTPNATVIGVSSRFGL